MTAALFDHYVRVLQIERAWRKGSILADQARVDCKAVDVKAALFQCLGNQLPHAGFIAAERSRANQIAWEGDFFVKALFHGFDDAIDIVTGEPVRLRLLKRPSFTQAHPP
uniref:hypothetical protein n=1 Tax=Sinorhizobium chiapasense TaxID=501572 RepID=UPI0038CD6294